METEVKKELTELEALEAIKTQVSAFKEALGEKADEAKIKDLNEKIEDLQSKLESGEDIKDINDRLTKINLANEKLHNAVKQLEIDRLKEKEGNVTTSKSKRLKKFQESLKSFRDELFDENGEKKSLKHIKTEFALKDAEEFGAVTFEGGEDTDITAFTGRFVDPTLNQKKRKTNIILDYFNIPQINVPSLVYLRKIEIGAEPDTSDTGGAEWILCGDKKPRRSFRVTTGTAEAKKVAIFNTIDDCLLQDVPSFMNWVREDFRAEMNETINDGLLNGDLTNNQPMGLKENAITYGGLDPFDETIVGATEIDAIVAAAAYMASKKETPALAFVSTSVFYKILIAKDNNARYQNSGLVYVNNVGQLFIAGVQVVAVDSDDVPDTHLLLLGADPGFKIFAYGNMVIETGLNGEDFREDKTSIRGYQRFISYIAEERENSVLYDTWDNIISDISLEVEEEGEGGGTN